MMPTPSTIVTAQAPTVPLTSEGLRSALAALGDNPGRIHDRLFATGCFGRFGRPGRCPVAVYLWQTFGTLAIADVRVFGAAIILETVDGRRLDVVTPPSVRGFITTGDSGAFPDLESPDEW